MCLDIVYQIDIYFVTSSRLFYSEGAQAQALGPEYVTKISSRMEAIRCTEPVTNAGAFHEGPNHCLKGISIISEAILG